MKINIDLKLIKNSIFNKRVCGVTLCFVIFLEILAVSVDNISKKEINVEQSQVEEIVEFKDVIKDLKDRKLESQSIERGENNYIVSVVIEGTKEEFQNNLEKIKGFSVEDYEIDIENNHIKGIFKINYPS